MQEQLLKNGAQYLPPGAQVAATATQSTYMEEQGGSWVSLFRLGASRQVVVDLCGHCEALRGV